MIKNEIIIENLLDKTFCENISEKDYVCQFHQTL